MRRRIHRLVLGGVTRRKRSEVKSENRWRKREYVGLCTERWMDWRERREDERMLGRAGCMAVLLGIPLRERF